MSFDAFMVRAVATELEKALTGARVEKVLQPSKDEIFLALHRESEHLKLQINAGAQSARIGITGESPENPKVPPMFCMLLRKHLTGAKISRVFQRGFERVIEIELETYDEMGFFTKRRLITEIMGRYSNAVLCDDAYKIINVLRPVDFTTSRKRQLLPQMTYEMPPSQDKVDPFGETREAFLKCFSALGEIDVRSLTDRYIGFSPLTAREIVMKAENNGAEALWEAFAELLERTRNGDFVPTMLVLPSGKPQDFSCFEPKHCVGELKTVRFGSFGELTDGFFAEKERRERERSRAHATERVLKNAESRLVKKLELQAKELKDTEKKADYKRQADLITANIYRFKGDVTELSVTDYVDDGNGGYREEQVEIKLERGLNAPTAAQKLYKKYAKAKNAEIEITTQMEKGEAELRYVRSVLDALSRSVGQAELDEIRAELSETGYIRISDGQNKKNGKGAKNASSQKQIKNPIKSVTSSGFTVYTGKNNLQNDYLTFKIASKSDYWFHVKGVPGSHTVLICDGREPTERDLTEAAIIAAKNSKAAEQDRADVDYTRIKNVKKPSGARPGYVIYDGYNTATVQLNAPVTDKTEY